jgi:retron-type reverse transcriptase
MSRGRKIENRNLETSFLRARSLQECLDKIIKNKNGIKFSGLHKLISDPEFLTIAYIKLRKNKGLYTPGTDGETLDGLNFDKLKDLGRNIHTGFYKPRPVRRIMIDKVKGGQRPLGIPSAIDKIPQEAIRMILEHIYEPLFLPTSHGFRPRKSCHSALNYYKMRFQGVSWIIKMDIKGCFNNIMHSKLINSLSELIDDKAFFDLM